MKWMLVSSFSLFKLSSRMSAIEGLMRSGGGEIGPSTIDNFVQWKKDKDEKEEKMNTTTTA